MTISMISNMKIDSITASLVGHEDRWVALTDQLDRVIASGESLKDVMERASRAYNQHPVFMKVLSSEFTVSPDSYGV